MPISLKNFLTKGLMSLLLVTASTSSGLADMTKDEIRKGYKVNATLAQFHRWYQVYERPDGGIENALDILTKDVKVISGLGEANGHDDYQARVSKLPTSWMHAHFPKNTQVTFNDDGTISLTANITYYNKGLNPEGKIREADLDYTMVLNSQDEVLPKFSSIKITQNSDGFTDTYIDAYATNRMRSLAHYWLALIEDPSRNPGPVKEILDNDFSLNFSSGKITNFDGFKEWLAGPGSQVTASTHVISNFEAKEIANGEFAIKMDFDWEGILPNGSELIAKTRHSWTATNNIKERFARIKSMDVEVLEPFRPKEN